MRIKVFLAIAVLVLPLAAIAQPQVIAETELLIQIPVNRARGGFYFNLDEEGYRSWGGPMIDNEGALYFLPMAGDDAFSYLIKFANGCLENVPLFRFMNDRDVYRNYCVYFSFQGVVIDLVDESIFSINNGDRIIFERSMINADLAPSNHIRNYILPWGTLFESLDPKWLYSIEQEKNGSINIRDAIDTRKWLIARINGYSIEDDGLLYQNGIQYSANSPLGIFAVSYIGRLKSGHTIWAGNGHLGREQGFCFGNSIGEEELVLLMPWVSMEEEKINQTYSYSIGPWGEIYALVTPPLQLKSREYKPIPNVPAELVVIRNHLKYFGRLNEGGVRLRSEPNALSEILGTYPAKTGFRILETGTMEETIGGKKSVWYKVRLLDGKEGWFFGAFVHNLYDGPNGKAPPWPNVADW